MTRVTTTPLAVSADYADALLAARRAKNWLFFLLLLMLLTQLTIFFLVRFDVGVRLGTGGEASVTTPTGVDVDADADVEADAAAPTTDQSPTTGESPATAPTTGESITPGEGTATPPSLMALQDNTRASADLDVDVDATGNRTVTTTALAWVTNSIVYLGTIFSIIMAIIILLIVLIMLVGRLIGVSHSTSGFIWAVVLALLLFPWQLFYGPETAGMSGYTSATAGSASASVDSQMNDFRVPGVLYTWGELRRDAKFPTDDLKHAFLKWARFAGFPALALIILFMVQTRSGRAVKYALGEAEVHVDVATTDT